MDAYLQFATLLQTLVGTGRDALTRRLNGRDDRGQGTIEYVGMIIVAALIVVALLQTNMGATISGKFTEKIKSVLDFNG